MILTDLADACRKSGLKVVEVPGWQERGRDLASTPRKERTSPMVAVQTIVPHHTATKLSVPGDYPTLDTVVRGRSDLPGPLAQLGLGRSSTVYVIAAGVCFHAGATFLESQDNWHAIGIEAEHDGLSPWPSDLHDAYARLCAALAEHYGLSWIDVEGHKEIATPLGRKTDPNFDMDNFRAKVRDEMEANMPLNDADKKWISELLDEKLRLAGDSIKVDHDDDPETPRISLERVLAKILRR